MELLRAFVRLVVVALLVVPIGMLLDPGDGVLAARNCTQTELRPGYPGYQGFVTGVDGVGDVGCVEELEEQHPRFSKREEDRENERAAARLGIAGSANDWTWENWMAIEAERGLAVTCYVCAFANAENRDAPANSGVDANDPRLACGTLGDTFLMTFERQQYGGAAWGDPVDDYEFRALVTLIYGDPYLNAEQLLTAYDQYGADWITESMKPGGKYVPSSWLWGQILDRGGYFPVPETATPEDQIFVMRIAFGAIVANGMMANDMLGAYHGMLEQAITSWKADLATGQTDLSLRDYLISIGAEEWLH